MSTTSSTTKAASEQKSPSSFLSEHSERDKTYDVIPEPRIAQQHTAFECVTEAEDVRSRGAVSSEAEPMDTTENTTDKLQSDDITENTTDKLQSDTESQDLLKVNHQETDVVFSDNDVQLLDDVNNLEKIQPISLPRASENIDSMVQNVGNDINSIQLAENTNTASPAAKSIDADSGIEQANTDAAAAVKCRVESSVDLSDDNNTADYSGDESSVAMSQSLDTTADSLFEMRLKNEEIQERAQLLNKG